MKSLRSQNPIFIKICGDYHYMDFETLASSRAYALRQVRSFQKEIARCITGFILRSPIQAQPV